MQQHRDPVAGADAACGECARDAGDALVQLGVGALAPVEDERDARGAGMRQVVKTVHALTPGAP